MQNCKSICQCCLIKQCSINESSALLIEQIGHQKLACTIIYHDQGQTLKQQCSYEIKNQQQCSRILQINSLAVSELSNDRTNSMGAIMGYFQRIRSIELKINKLKNDNPNLSDQLKKQKTQNSQYAIQTLLLAKEIINELLERINKRNKLLLQVMFGFGIFASLIGAINLITFVMQVSYLFIYLQEMKNTNKNLRLFLFNMFFFFFFIILILLLFKCNTKKIIQMPTKFIVLTIVVKIFASFFIICINFCHLYIIQHMKNNKITFKQRIKILNNYFPIFQTAKFNSYRYYLVMWFWAINSTVFISCVFIYLHDSNYNYAKSINSSMDTILLMISIIKVSLQIVMGLNCYFKEIQAEILNDKQYEQLQNNLIKMMIECKELQKLQNQELNQMLNNLKRNHNHDETLMALNEQINQNGTFMERE